MTYHVEDAPSTRAASCGSAARSRSSRARSSGAALAAVNLDTGKVAWKHDTEQPLIGGVLATAGDLVFNGEGNGCFNALDAGHRQEAVEASTAAPAPTRLPVSYMVGGKQYIAVGCGGNTQLDFKRGNSVFVFAVH